MQIILINCFLRKKLNQHLARPAMLQWTLSTSDQYEDPSAHEIDVEKGMDKFSEVMDQFGS